MALRAGDQMIGSAVFLQFVEKTDTCWLWTRSKNAAGYGACGILSDGTQGAHRAAWLLFVGPIPENMQVLHKCDVRNCVRPDHLFLGDQSTNIKDAVQKGRWKQTPVGYPAWLPKGVAHHAAKLNPESAREIKQHLQKGVSLTQLATMYGITKQSVLAIKRGQSWREV